MSADCIGVRTTDRPTTGGGNNTGFSAPLPRLPPPGGGAAFLGATEGGSGFAVGSLIVVLFVFSFLVSSSSFVPVDDGPFLWCLCWIVWRS